MIVKDDMDAVLRQNAERVTALFERYATQFETKNMPHLADRWRRILHNYRRAVDAKLQGA